jgi:hypothetical protein
MPRTAASTKSLVAEFTSNLERIVAAAHAEGRDAALAEVRGLIGGGASLAGSLVVAQRRGRPFGSKNKAPGAAAKAPKAKRAKARRSSWAGLSPEARLARVNAIRVGRGLAPKTAL